MTSLKIKIRLTSLKQKLTDTTDTESARTGSRRSSTLVSTFRPESYLIKNTVDTRFMESVRLRYQLYNIITFGKVYQVPFPTPATIHWIM